MKTTSRNIIHNVNFMEPVQTSRAHETLMHDINREVRYVNNKYSVCIDLLYFEWDKLIPTLENHFPDIIEGLFNCDHQWCVLVHNQDQFIPVCSNKLNTNFRCCVKDGG